MFGIRPHVRAVIADEDGDISDDANAVLGTVAAQGSSTAQRTQIAESAPHPVAGGSSARSFSSVAGIAAGQSSSGQVFQVCSSKRSRKTLNRA